MFVAELEEEAAAPPIPSRKDQLGNRVLLSGAGVCILAVGILIGILVGRRNAEPQPDRTGGPVAVRPEQERRFWAGGDNGGKEKRWARSDFQKLVLGKTQEEIRKILGDPDEVILEARGCNGEGWLYRGRTYIPPAKNVDGYVVILFNRFHGESVFSGPSRYYPGRRGPGATPEHETPRLPPPPHPDEGKILPAHAVSYPDGTVWGA
jgi:hypothetical protein